MYVFNCINYDKENNFITFSIKESQGSYGAISFLVDAVSEILGCDDPFPVARIRQTKGILSFSWFCLILLLFSPPESPFDVPLSVKGSPLRIYDENHYAVFIRMDTLAVVKYPDIFKCCHLGLFMGFEMLFIKPFLFQLAPKALHGRIISAVSFAAHPHDKSDFFCPFTVII